MIRQGGWLLGLSLACLAAGGVAGTEERPDPVESGRRALSESASYPWYDAQADALQRIEVRAPRESAVNRDSRWQAKPSNMNLSFPAQLMRILWEMLRVLFWAVLVGILTLLIVLLARRYLRTQGDSPEGAETLDRSGPRVAGDVIEKLPFQLPRTQHGLLEEAQRLYEAGAFGEALIYLFSYQLVALDQHHLIRLARGKTNRQYLLELGTRRPVRGIFERTMIAFEDFFFGRHAVDRERFESCWRRLDEFHGHLGREGAA
jgi:hypothetical protein